MPFPLWKGQRTVALPHWQSRPAFDRTSRCADAIGCSRVSTYRVSEHASARSRKNIQALVTQPSIKAQVDSGSGAPVGGIAFNYSMMSFGGNGGATIANPLRKLLARANLRGLITCFIKSRPLLDNRIEIVAVFHGTGLRFEAIFLRRATMINMITTNRTPAMMRIVVGSIEALSLKYMRHGFR